MAKHNHIDPPRFPHLTDPLENGMKDKFKVTLTKMIKDINQSLNDDIRDNQKSTEAG